MAQLEIKPDIEVILLDVKMPGIDGIEVLREIKKKLPLVVASFQANGTADEHIRRPRRKICILSDQENSNMLPTAWAFRCLTKVKQSL